MHSHDPRMKCRLSVLMNPTDLGFTCCIIGMLWTP